MNIFFEGPKNRSSTCFLNERLWFSRLLVVFLWRKSNIKTLLVSLKSHTNCELPSSNLLQRACSGERWERVKAAISVMGLQIWWMFFKIKHSNRGIKLTRKRLGPAEKRYEIFCTKSARHIPYTNKRSFFHNRRWNTYPNLATSTDTYRKNSVWESISRKYILRALLKI